MIDIMKDFEDENTTGTGNKINNKNRSIITKELFAYAFKMFGCDVPV